MFLDLLNVYYTWSEWHQSLCIWVNCITQWLQSYEAQSRSCQTAVPSQPKRNTQIFVICRYARCLHILHIHYMIIPVYVKIRSVQDRFRLSRISFEEAPLKEAFKTSVCRQVRRLAVWKLQFSNLSNLSLSFSQPSGPNPKPNKTKTIWDSQYCGSLEFVWTFYGSLFLHAEQHTHGYCRLLQV